MYQRTITNSWQFSSSCKPIVSMKSIWIDNKQQRASHIICVLKSLLLNIHVNLKRSLRNYCYRGHRVTAQFTYVSWQETGEFKWLAKHFKMSRRKQSNPKPFKSKYVLVMSRVIIFNILIFIYLVPLSLNILSLSFLYLFEHVFCNIQYSNSYCL